MANAHAQVALENKEGAERAREDFIKGITVNPFDMHSGWRRRAWGRQMLALVNRRDCIAAGHDRTKCCWQHEHHVDRCNKLQRGITSCARCEVEAEVERRRREAAEATVGA